jgi:hypothetical protein|tara:strand:+ start:47961 stop:48302 length:342 start_codon:yes stop_codon:yes gene_type:complete
MILHLQQTQQPPWLIYFRPINEYPESPLIKAIDHFKPVTRSIIHALIDLDDPAGFTSQDLALELDRSIQWAAAWLLRLTKNGIVARIDSQPGAVDLARANTSYAYRFNSRFYC